MSWYVTSEEALEFLVHMYHTNRKIPATKLVLTSGVLAAAAGFNAIKALAAKEPQSIILHTALAATSTLAAYMTARSAWDWLQRYDDQHTYYVPDGFTRDVRKPDKFLTVHPTDDNPHEQYTQGALFLNGVHIKRIEGRRPGLMGMWGRYNGHDLNLVHPIETIDAYQNLVQAMSQPADFWMECSQPPTTRCNL